MQSLTPIEGGPIDGGPFYAETDLNSFIAEPWNALSSLAIALPAIYWAFRLKWQVKHYPFLFFLMPFLFLGGIGSTLYHAFRVSPYLLWMDVLPTAIVTFSISVFFWDKVLPKRWQAAIFLVPITLMRFFLQDYLPVKMAININYFITGTLIFVPVIIYLIKTDLQYLTSILLSVLMLSLSLLFRRLDHFSAEWIPMGSHFLWHIFSGIGAYYMAQYLYLLRRDELANPL